MGTKLTSAHRNPIAQVAQVRALYEKTDESIKSNGRQWYLREHQEAVRLAKQTGHRVRLVCACLAVLSPRCQWQRAKAACELLLEGKKPQGIFAHNLAKAARILTTGNTDLIHPNQAPKTWAFWQNLWKPSNPEPVTLDSWMFRAHNLPAATSITIYRTLADSYRAVAAELDLIPNQLQAIIWLHVKANHTRLGN